MDLTHVLSQTINSLKQKARNLNSDAPMGHLKELLLSCLNDTFLSVWELGVLDKCSTTKLHLFKTKRVLFRDGDFSMKSGAARRILRLSKKA